MSLETFIEQTEINLNLSEHPILDRDGKVKLYGYIENKETTYTAKIYLDEDLIFEKSIPYHKVDVELEININKLTDDSKLKIELDPTDIEGEPYESFMDINLLSRKYGDVTIDFSNHKHDYIQDENIKVEIGKGLALTNVRKGYFDIPISTKKRSYIENIKPDLWEDLYNLDYLITKDNVDTTLSTISGPLNLTNLEYTSYYNIYNSDILNGKTDLVFKFNEPELLNLLYLKVQSVSYVGYIQRIEIHGTNDLMEWNILDSVMVPSTHDSNEIYIPFNNSNLYKYYKIFISDFYKTGVFRLTNMTLYKETYDHFDYIEYVDKMEFIEMLDGGYLYEYPLRDSYTSIDDLYVDLKGDEEDV